MMYNGKIFFEFPAMIFAYLTGMQIYNYSKLKNSKYLISGFEALFAFIYGVMP